MKFLIVIALAVLAVKILNKPALNKPDKITEMKRLLIVVAYLVLCVLIVIVI